MEVLAPILILHKKTSQKIKEYKKRIFVKFQVYGTGTYFLRDSPIFLKGEIRPFPLLRTIDVNCVVL